MNFLLMTALAVSHKFWIVLFHLFPETFSFLPWSHFWTIHCFTACYSISVSLSVFEFFPWGWLLVSVPCGQRKCLIWFQYPEFFESLVSYYVVCLWKCSVCIWKECVFLLLWDGRPYIYQLGSFDLGHCWMPKNSILFGRSIHCLQCGVKISQYKCVAVYTFPEILKDTPYVFGSSYVLYIYVYNVYVFFPWVLWCVL